MSDEAFSVGGVYAITWWMSGWTLLKMGISTRDPRERIAEHESGYNNPLRVRLGRSRIHTWMTLGEAPFARDAETAFKQYVRRRLPRINPTEPGAMFRGVELYLPFTKYCPDPSGEWLVCGAPHGFAGGQFVYLFEAARSHAAEEAFAEWQAAQAGV